MAICKFLKIFGLDLKFLKWNTDKPNTLEEGVGYKALAGRVKNF